MKNIGSTPAKMEKVWTSLFAENKFSTRGMDLVYVALIVKDGAKLAKLDEDEVD